MTRSTEQKKDLRALYYAAQLGSKPAAQKVKAAFSALRVSSRRKPAPRKAAAAHKPAPPLERDNGDRLMAARDFARQAHHAAQDAFNRYRNAPEPVARLVAAVSLLPMVPSANHSLRQWRDFTAKIEAARPRVEKLMQAIR